MPLSDDDVREILRIIDESDLDELRVETEGLSLHVVRGGAVPAAAPVEVEPMLEETGDGVTIEAPMLGTFYRAEAPGAAPFVELGTHVEPDTIVCLIEVMKMFTSVVAPCQGRIVEILIQDATMVEYGQPLMYIEPS